MTVSAFEKQNSFKESPNKFLLPQKPHPQEKRLQPNMISPYSAEFKNLSELCELFFLYVNFLFYLTVIF